MGGRRPRVREQYDRKAFIAQFDRDWDARQVRLEALKSAGVPESQADTMLRRVDYGPPVFEPSTPRRGRRRHGGRAGFRRDTGLGFRIERKYHVERAEDHRRATVELRLAFLRPRKIAARAAGRAAVNMRREFLHADHESYDAETPILAPVQPNKPHKV